MTRPMLIKKARKSCKHSQSCAIRADLPNSYEGRQWCRRCGVFFKEGGVDWVATDAADAEDMERAGQMRLPEET